MMVTRGSAKRMTSRWIAGAQVARVEAVRNIRLLTEELSLSRLSSPGILGEGRSE